MHSSYFELYRMRPDRHFLHQKLVAFAARTVIKAAAGKAKKEMRARKLRVAIKKGATFPQNGSPKPSARQSIAIALLLAHHGGMVSGGNSKPVA